jgi:hypothetical protein
MFTFEIDVCLVPKADSWSLAPTDLLIIMLLKINLVMLTSGHPTLDAK